MNRKFIATLLAVLSFITVQGQGIEFFHGTYQEALQAAKEQNKSIFVDVYTSWCVPCRMMSQKTFTDASVGEYYNQNYICVKLDAEKQSESSFFKSYQATSFPSYFWLNSDGELLLKDGSYMKPEPFLELSRSVEKSNFAAQAKALAARWDGGERTVELLKEYVFEVVSTIDPSRVEGMVFEFLDTKSDEELRSEELYPIVMMTASRGIEDNKYSKLALQNAEYYKNYGKNDDYWVRMYRVIVRASAMHSENSDQFKSYMDLLDSVNSPLMPMYHEIIDIEAEIFKGNFAEVLPRIIPAVESYGADHTYLYSQLFYTLIIGDYFTKAPLVESELATVRQIALRAMEDLPCKENLMYIAATYTKEGNFDQAYQCLASLPFFGEPMLSNALYPRLNISFYGREFRE